MYAAPRRSLPLLALAAVLAAPAHDPALAAPALPRAPAARFSWTRGPAAGSCPDERTIARAVARRLGRRPFSEAAERVVEALVTREADGRFTAQLLLRDRAGVLLGERALTSEPDDCASLEAPASLAIALAIDPSASRAAPARAPTAAEVTALLAPEPAACAPARPAAPAPASPTAAPSYRPEAALSAVVALGLLPRTTLGAALSADAPLPVARRLALRAGMLWLPEVYTGDARFGFGLTAASLGACGLLAAAARFELTGCGALYAGAIHAVVYQLLPTAPGDRFWLAAGASARASLRLAGPLRAVLEAQALAPVLRHAFLVEGAAAPVFQQTPVTATLRVGLALSIP